MLILSFEEFNKDFGIDNKALNKIRIKDRYSNESRNLITSRNPTLI